MKIGIEVQRLFRKKKFGIETSALELINTLQQLDSKNQFVIFARDDEDRGCITPSENLTVRTVGGRFFADFEQVFLPLAAKDERVDVLHCTGNTAPFLSPAPVVQTLHDVIFMDSIPSGDSLYQRFGNLYRRKVVPHVTPRSHTVITVSHYEKDRIIQRLRISPDKIHVVYNGLNEKRFHPRYDADRREAVRKKYNLPETFILFLGNQTARKNPGRAIEAYVKYAAMTDNALAFMTPGLSEKFVIDKLKALNFPYEPQRFITPGYINESDLPIVYGLSKAFLFPSLSEGFGMPLIEAMACGTAVVCSNASSLPEIAGNAAILTNPLKPEEMAAGLLSLTTDDELRARRIEAGFKNARRFNWRQAAEHMLQVYESAYAASRAREKVSGAFNKEMLAARD